MGTTTEKKVLVRTIKETIETKREVELPYFSKVKNTFYYKVFGTGDKDAIKVYLGYRDNPVGIEVSYIDTALSLDTEISTEQEFEEAYQAAIKVLTELKNK